jgi:hypothetical protein
MNVREPTDVTSDWLTDIVRKAGYGGIVSKFESISIGTGQVGDNIRYTLEGNGDLPTTVVGKFASPDPVSRQTGIDTENYRREVHFYNHLQKKVKIQTPACYLAEVDDDTHEFVIMMEDLAPGIQGDQLGGCLEPEARLAMTQLAHLHGPVWADRSLTSNPLISDQTSPERATSLSALYSLVAPGFLDRYAERLTPEEKEMVRLVGNNLRAYTLNYGGDCTLIHIDYRLDNMMFGGPYPLAVVDWQSPAFGCALNDVAYFTGTSVKEASRLDLEKSLVKTYFDTLTAYEVSLSWEDCWHYYRHFSPAGLIMAVVASMIVGETPRGNDMFMVMAKRSARMCRELDAIEAICAG